MATSPSHNNDTVGNASFASASASTFEVFLNFCGKDTRKGFTDFLYTYLDGASVCTFMDDNELRVGEEIGPELLKAIKESKISIPIFSKNYASSKWCLLELAQMVECHTTQGQMIFPIFYDVNPHDVQHQSGSYEEAFRQHRKRRFDEKTVKEWKEALRKVGVLKGLELNNETHGHEGKLVKIIVEKVLSELAKNYKYEPQNLVGMDSHIEKLKGLLNIDSEGVKIVGIHGMGGLGKTTIARVIYNQLFELFECHCFLEDVRENSQNHNGNAHLQHNLLIKILNREVPNLKGIDRLKNAVYGKKVFIVLDDVDEMSQIEDLIGKPSWFGAGSRIVITTRNKGVLDEFELTCQVEGLLEVYQSYKPNFMDDDHSLELFSKYAFRRNSPPEDYKILAKEVVSTAAGLPLVLKTLGSLLFAEKDKYSWEEKLKKLKAIPHKKVLGKLRISYDALDNEQKQIFLDIACLFIGEDKTNPCYMWDDCEFYPRDGVNVLVRRSLITIGNDNTLRMHDQLRDLGRHIVCEKNPNDPGKWSRMWRRDKALAICRTHQGTKSVEALCLPFNYGRRDKKKQFCRLTGQDLGQLPNLRYLSLEAAELGGDFQNCLLNLRWLEWCCRGKFAATNLHLKNLVILDLSLSTIPYLWGGWSVIKMAKRLKVLKLSYCRNLRRVPHLSTFATLESLEVDHCSSLCRLDGLEQLESLKYLNTSHCTALERLPNLLKLRKLQTLNVKGCKNLTLIQGLDNLESLELLQMSRCNSLETLPNLSNLKKLKTLDASSCEKLIKIQGPYRLESLEHFDMRSCASIERLPDLSNSKRLKNLEISECGKLIEIQGLDGLESLEHFDMSFCISVEKLPDLSSLRKLKELNFSNCYRLIEIQGPDRLESLEHMDMSHCKSLERLPDLRNLGMLKDIDLCGHTKLHEVEGLCFVESLESLNVSFCKALGKTLDLPKFKCLKQLNIGRFKDLTEIQGLEELKSLEWLNISGCKSIEKLPDFSNLTNLKYIDVSRCEKLTEIRGLEELKCLTAIDIAGCKSLKNLPNLPKTRYISDFTMASALLRCSKRERLKLLSSKRIPLMSMGH